MEQRVHTLKRDRLAFVRAVQRVVGQDDLDSAVSVIDHGVGAILDQLVDLAATVSPLGGRKLNIRVLVYEARVHLVGCQAGLRLNVDVSHDLGVHGLQPGGSSI